jgi:hypothetical protein
MLSLHLSHVSDSVASYQPLLAELTPYEPPFL